uniref:NADH-ubiquinone oxidoreductase chain 2 n=1 Tax=Aleurochiton aceris TaxID=266942 RepID=Q697G7_ALEAC|nr:NADH dehydrogenase subunit 2 [Aleurochiton aceris]
MSNFKLWFSFMLFYLSLISLFCNNWLAVWMVMEVNVLFLMGILSLTCGYESSSTIMKYFIVQLIISLVFLTFILSLLFNIFMSVNLWIMIVLMAKLGLFPFHFWMIMILSKIDWTGFFMMSTFYKLPSLMYTHWTFELLTLSLVVISSSFVGSFLGLNNIFIQKLLGYSSLSHLSWLLLSLSLSVQMFSVYMVSYTIILLTLSLMFNYLNIYYINQFKFFSRSTFTLFMLVFVILSLMGFPPFMGFVVKWFVMKFLLYLNFNFMLFFMLLVSVMSVVFYLQLFYYMIMIYNINFKWHYPLFYNLTVFSCVFLNLLCYLFVYFCI